VQQQSGHYRDINYLLFFNASNVTGNIVISGTAIPIPYTVTAPANTSLTNMTARHLEPYNTTLRANTGWVLPATITMTRNGASFTNFTYNSTSGDISIFGTHVTGNFVISGTAIQRLNAPVLYPEVLIEPTDFIAIWSSVTGATRYRLDVSTNSNFTSFVSGYNDRNVGSNTVFHVTGLNPDTTYYYRVRARDGNNVSSNSNVRSVRTLAGPSLTVSPTNINVSASATTAQVTITSNGAWTASSNVIWARVSVEHGSGTRVISISIDSNNSTMTRPAIITISAGNVTSEIHITQSGMTSDYIDLRVAFYYHKTYTDVFLNNHSTNANRTLSDASIAFLGMFRMNLIYTSGKYVNVTMSMDKCEDGYYSTCSYSCCGESHSDHEKSSVKNMNDFDFGNTRIFDQSHSSMGILAYSAALCYLWSDGTHGSVGGAARAPGRTSMVWFRHDIPNSYRLNVRTLQHELSHNFGLDYNVKCIADCIMSGGFDNTDIFEITDIWCTNHANQFRRNLH